MAEPLLDLREDHLSIKQVFNAPASRLFECFTTPEHLSQWHAPGNMTIPVAEVDLRVGGKFRIEMKNDEGQVHTAIGEYREIDSPSKLVYTWAWENGDGPETLVTVLFSDMGGSTEIELIHTGFAEASAAEHHSQGWTGILARLGQFI